MKVTSQRDLLINFTGFQDFPALAKNVKLLLKQLS